MSNVVRLDAGRKGGEGGINGGDVEPGLEGIRVLGFAHERYFYLSPLTQQLVELSASDHNEPNLCRLRELRWWVEQFPASGRNRGKFDLSLAREQLMSACHRVGPFNLERLRGIGIYWDETLGAIVHGGQWVSADCKSWRPSDVPLEHVYEAGGSWSNITAEPLDDDEASRLLRLCERFAWVDEVYARLLAGWCVVAPVCGAMRWRPHIALTGPTQSGKSFVAREVVVTVLGALGLFVEGETTSAGIRQTLGRDARPIVWDEAEPQGAKGMSRVQDALAFARSLSTADGGKVIKGGANHRATAFGGVGCLCLVSIYSQAMREADMNRFTTLELCSRAGTAPTKADVATVRALELLDAAYARSLLGRTVAHLAALRASHAVFAEAVARRWNSRRLGDQLGALLAGAHLLESTEAIAAEDATAQVAALPEHLGQLPTGVTDEERCLQRLITYWTRVDTAGGKRQVTRTIGELIELVLLGAGEGDEIDPAIAKKVLLRHGVRVLFQNERKPLSDEVTAVAVASHHDRLLDIYRDTDFAGGWARLLERLGGQRSDNAVRFGPGAQSRATLLPKEMFLDAATGAGG